MVKTGTRHLCDIKLGYRSLFWGHTYLFLIPDCPDDPAYAIPLTSITPGDLLPRDTDKPLL